MGDGKWEDELWVKSLLQSRGLDNIRISIVTKDLNSGTPVEQIQAIMAPARMITQKMWTEGQREKFIDKFLNTCFQFSIQEAGSQDTEMIKSWTALIITAQKPL
jgi:hypothetical protein